MTDKSQCCDGRCCDSNCCDTRAVMLVGVGGQGTILASKILSEGLLRAGYDVKMSEIHGMSQRGGSVTTHVKFGSKVYSPIIDRGQADILVSFEKVEAVRCLEYLKPSGMLVVNAHEIHPLSVLTGSAIYPDSVESDLKGAVQNIIYFDAGKIAEELGNIKAQNIVLLGALVKGLKLDNIDWHSVISDLVPPKMTELNIRAFDAGQAQI